MVSLTKIIAYFSLKVKKIYLYFFGELWYTVNRKRFTRPTGARKGKEMRLIVCIDERKGLLFCGKRQSQDRVLRERVLERVKDERLLLSPYSFKQFGEHPAIAVSQNPLAEAKKDDYYFLEDMDFSLKDCQEVILYHWNRHYPSTVKFDVDLKKEGYRLSLREDFKGSSHDKITEEIWTKEN